MIHRDSAATRSAASSPSGECGSCLLGDRRGFFREAAAAVAALVALGVQPTTAGAVPVEWISSLVRGADEARYPIPAADGVQIDRDKEVILVRWQNAVYAFNLSCPHQNTALRWEDADGRFQCPKHHSKYQPDGTFISGRATRNMDRFTVRRDGDMIVADLDAMHKSNDDQAAWAASVIHL